MTTASYTEGQIVGRSMAIGIAVFGGLGVALAVATDTLALIGVGPAIGVAVGSAVGATVERRYREEGRLLEQDGASPTRRWWVILAVLGVLALLGVLTLTLVAT